MSGSLVARRPGGTGLQWAAPASTQTESMAMTQFEGFVGKRRRSFLIGSIGALGAAATGLSSGLARAQAGAAINGVWNLNANYYPGTLDIRQGGDGSLDGSTMYGEPIRGFYSPVQGKVVLLRGPATRPTQVFVGTVTGTGSNSRINGSFYALTPSMGATRVRNRFNFVASRPPLAFGPEPLVGQAAGPGCLNRSFVVYNRPSEYRSWTMPLVFDSAPCISDSLEENFDTDRFYGHYASGSGSLVFMRLNGGAPAQFYSARVDPYWFEQQIGGSFCALTSGMGAGTERIEYDWWAHG